MQVVGNYWHMLPEYSQARKAIWDAVNPRTGKRRIDEAFPLEIRSKTRENDMHIKFVSGSTWQLLGSDSFDSYVGSPPIGIVFSEWALADSMCWPYIMPILEENGGWALFITTSRGDNHAWHMLEYAKTDSAWFQEVTPASRTKVFTVAQLESIRHQLMTTFGDEIGEALYQQEYHCSKQGAILGAYYAKQMLTAKNEGRVGNYPHQPSQEVYTAWDLGVDDSMSIWFYQEIGKSIHVIDYIEASGYGLEHYAKEMRVGQWKSDGWPRSKYRYGGHTMPHDVEAREMTNSEIALTRREVAEGLGISPISVVQRTKNMDIIVQVHIPAVRNFLARCKFNEATCSRGISALENYRSEYDEEKKKLGNRPLHNWASHGASAFCTLVLGHQPRGVVSSGPLAGWDLS